MNNVNYRLIRWGFALIVSCFIAPLATAQSEPENQQIEVYSHENSGPDDGDKIGDALYYLGADYSTPTYSEFYDTDTEAYSRLDQLYGEGYNVEYSPNSQYNNYAGCQDGGTCDWHNTGAEVLPPDIQNFIQDFLTLVAQQVPWSASKSVAFVDHVYVMPAGSTSATDANLVAIAAYVRPPETGLLIHEVFHRFDTRDQALAYIQEKMTDTSWVTPYVPPIIHWP